MRILLLIKQVPKILNIMAVDSGKLFEADKEAIWKCYTVQRKREPRGDVQLKPHEWENEKLRREKSQVRVERRPSKTRNLKDLFRCHLCASFHKTRSSCDGVINLGNDLFDTEKLPRSTLPMATEPTTSGVHLTRVTGATGMPSLDRDLVHP